MNPIQKGLLIAFRPFMEFFNRSIATRSGLLGKFGKFYKFGPREYGAHTTTKFFRYINYVFLSATARALNQYPIIKSLTARNHYTLRHLVFFRPVVVMSFFGFFLMPYFANPFVRQRENDLANLNMGTPFGMLPSNSMKFRQSAHYMEINQRYFNDMLDIYNSEYDKIKQERLGLDRKERLTKFNGDYEYVEFKQA